MPVNDSNTAILSDRRKYNQWVANETLEDFALRHTARRARKWSFSRITNTALGTSSFLALELLGGTIALSYGVYHSLWAIVIVCALLFLSGLPISYYATRYSVDIDLLTRGAGFGYIGSTISSLIYASFTFIFFAIEAAIMASALELLVGLPLWLGYIVSVLVVIPLVTFGITLISRFQLITQPIWLILQLAPIIYIAQQPEGFIQQWLNFGGTEPGSEHSTEGTTFNLVTFGLATTVLFALVAQIGEQVDFLRFLPEKKKGQSLKWWTSIVIAGPGWVFFGALKLILGTMLAFMLVSLGTSPSDSSDPTRMYSMAFEHFINNPLLALIVAAIFVIVCQVKINVANAYAGSLAWSNFFSRLTHHHPGRVVWLIFNVSIALMLMELGLVRSIEIVLHHYSAFVLAWFGSIVADLVINKPLGLSPKFIEFKRSRLYDINPVGVISTLAATLLGVLSSTGFFGELASAMSGFIAFGLPFITVPFIAAITKGKYYLAEETPEATEIRMLTSTEKENIQCVVCENKFDQEDMNGCPWYGGDICSLCCALETRCKDQCRPTAHIYAQLRSFFKPLLGKRSFSLLSGPLGHFVLIFLTLSFITLGVFYLPYLPLATEEYISSSTLFLTLATIYFLLLIIMGVLVWLFVLAQKSTRMALQDINLQTQRLTKEVTAHKHTFQQLERAKRTADSANIAKSDYVTSLSHELRTPLNVILGYAQILQNDQELNVKQMDSLAIMRRNGEHLANMIEGLLEISKIEAGKLSLNLDQVRLDIMLDQLIKMFSQQANAKGLYFKHSLASDLPRSIKVDEKRLRQILINLLSNAIKFTEKGGVEFHVSYRSHVARFKIKDTGFGLSKENQKTIFIPFERGAMAKVRQISGSGLGLAICRQLADMMGAEIEVESEEGVGSTFTLLMQASPSNTLIPEVATSAPIIGYKGRQRTILVADDNTDHCQLIIDLLTPLGFNVLQCHDGAACIDMLSHPIDLGLLDVRLGDDSGWDVIKQLRNGADRLPVIMVSANARGFLNTMPEQKLHDDYLEKPLQFDALLEKLGQLMGLEWKYEEEATQIPKSNADEINNSVAISVDYLEEWHELRKLAKIGNYNAITARLSQLVSQEALPIELFKELNVCLKRFDFASFESKLNDIIHTFEHQ